MIATIASSRKSGTIEKSRNRSRKSTPFTPRSMIRLSPPVRRVMWKRRLSAWMCPKVSSAIRLSARWPTTAKMPSRSWAKPTEAKRTNP
jgi:hypothetical protein